MPFRGSLKILQQNDNEFRKEMFDKNSASAGNSRSHFYEPSSLWCYLGVKGSIKINLGLTF